jgi:LysR family glycine cleavage system transcriptional activator
MPVRRDPPPTHALRAFEAVARLNSFKNAAIELGVTQSAVSQRVAALEAELGICLIRREPGRFELTREGSAYAATVRGVLSTLARAEERLADRRLIVRITVVPSFARCWLVPRLEALSSSLDDVCLHFHTSNQIETIGDGGYDLAIRLRPRADRSGERMTATDDILIAVSALARRPSGGARFSDPFDDMTLLEDDCSRLGSAPDQSWAAWYIRNGYEPSLRRRRILFNDAGLMIEAARSALGVALARRSLVDDRLASGDLIQHQGTPLESLGQTMLIQRPASSRTKASERVANWLLGATLPRPPQ